MNFSNKTDNELVDIWNKLFLIARNNNKLMTEIKYDIEYIIKKEERIKDIEEMMHLAKLYGGCKIFKDYIQWEGTEYFYSTYEHINAPYEVYLTYVKDKSCWCGKCR